jgi:hypothetical protein
MKIIDKKTKKRFLLNDLKRSNFAYLGFTLFAGLFFHNSFAFYDGRLSIKRGFKKEELQKYLTGSHSIIINQINPSRIYILKNIEAKIH